jgi:hypothetical protein
MTAIGEFAALPATQFKSDRIPDTQTVGNGSNQIAAPTVTPQGRTTPPSAKELTHIFLANSASTETRNSSSETRTIERGHPDFGRYREMTGPRDDPQPLSKGSENAGHTPFVPSTNPLYSVSNRYLGQFGLNPKDSGVFPAGKTGDKAITVRLSEETCFLARKAGDPGIVFKSVWVNGYPALQIVRSDTDGKGFVIPGARLTVEEGKLLVVSRSGTRAGPITVESFYKAVERYATKGDPAAKEMLDNFLNKK